MREYDLEWVKNRLAKRAEERKRSPIPEHLQRKLEHDREVQHLWLSARNRAREFEREFNITTEDIVIPHVCPVLGIPLKRSRQAYVKPNSPSLDRIDNSRGYIKGNVRVISHRANTLKSNATLEELTLSSRHRSTSPDEGGRNRKWTLVGASRSARSLSPRIIKSLCTRKVFVAK